MGKTKDLSAFEQSMVVGARHTVSRTATLLGFSRSTVSRVYKEWSTNQRTSGQPDTTWASIPVYGKCVSVYVCLQSQQAKECSQSGSWEASV
jgi:hypothetical protein